MLIMLANSAKPSGFANSHSTQYQPLFIEIVGKPESSFQGYYSIIADRENRLILTTNRDIYIYEGNSYRQIRFSKVPYISYNGNNEFVLSAGNEIFSFNFNKTGEFTTKKLIGADENPNNLAFTEIGFGNDHSLFLTTGRVLWRFNETLTQIDSSKQTISIHSTPKGVAFYSVEKGFYGLEGQSFAFTNNINKLLSPHEKAISTIFAGSYIFVTTSAKRMIMLNDKGEQIAEINQQSTGLTELPIDISTSDDVNFYAIVANKVYRFINPLLLDVYGINENLRGIINSSTKNNGEQYIATSYGLYKASKKGERLSFSAIEFGNFKLLYQSNDTVFAIGDKNLIILTKRQIVRVWDKDLFKKSRFINDSPAIYETSKQFIRLEIGETFTNQTIYSVNSAYNPDVSTFFVGKNSKAGNSPLFVIENSIIVNNVFLDSDSTLWLSTSSSLIKVSDKYLRQIRKSKLALKIYKSSTNEQERAIIPCTNIEVKVKQGEEVTFMLGSLGSNTWLSPCFSYKIDSDTSKWSDWVSKNTFTFKDLSSGNHRIAFKIRDAFGHESDEYAVFVRVIPRFFQTLLTQIAIIILLLIVLYAINRWRFFYFALERFKLESIINRRTEELIKEKEKTDNLLARVLPKETASELKETGKVSTQKFNMATVLFSDIQGFTRITDELNPENLIDQLDKFFLYFDSVVDKYGIEKIKTIGDAYMCAGGIPHKNRTNPVEVILAALEMLHYMHEINLEHSSDQNIWDLRIGIDTGPIIAGVVGRNKLSYDIWGTTVNTASRMESSGEAGRINISGNTHILVQDYFICTYRGKMPIKNKGDIEMYFIDGIKPSLSLNYNIYKPNSDFLLQLQFLRFGDLEEFILEKLEKGLPKNLHYHNLKHTVDVYTQVELIGRSENVSLEEQLLLQTAALFHDAGHLIDYNTHEEMGVKLAREILPQYQYSERQIQIISELIMVTKLPPKPKNLLEAIMCDADLDYLGRVDFIPVSNNLYKELHEHGRIGTIQEWNEMQIKFIEKHQYFTNTARKLRNVNKNSQLENIKNWIEKNKL